MMLTMIASVISIFSRAWEPVRGEDYRKAGSLGAWLAWLPSAGAVHDRVHIYNPQIKIL